MHELLKLNAAYLASALSEVPEPWLKGHHPHSHVPAAVERMIGLPPPSPWRGFNASPTDPTPWRDFNVSPGDPSPWGPQAGAFYEAVERLMSLAAVSTAVQREDMKRFIEASRKSLIEQICSSVVPFPFPWPPDNMSFSVAAQVILEASMLPNEAVREAGLSNATLLIDKTVGQFSAG